ncbi:MAG: aspartate aminotransferase family protein [Planctomycetota bacterium]|nr:MAG: aspartate aminotransferase family protein [Planctomycetota bacterium]
MATKEFPLEPQEVKPVYTKYRRIHTPVPVPQSIELLQTLRELEPRSMGGQPPIIWHHGRGATISDPYGNTWLDFSSGVLVTGTGHAHPEIIKAIKEMAEQGLYHAYCFPTEIRLRLIEELSSWLPAPLKRVFLLTTGSEATECCIKLARTHGQNIGGDRKSILVTFDNSFHGRTMGAQLAGGWGGQKSWLGDLDERFVQVPFPDGFRQQDTSFEIFEKSLADKGISPDDICGVMSETYQGCNATIIPAPYAQDLRKWCNKYRALLILDEVQAGFGRTGKPFGFSHLGIVPDLAACGKGISGGMPLSAVLGTEELMGMYGPGEMTSTHSANPICAAAALANLQVIKKENLIDNVVRMSPMLEQGLRRIQETAGDKIGHIDSIGLVGAIQFTSPGTTDPNPEMAWEMVLRAIQKGVMLFAPVGVGGCAVKINPPLVINEDALQEGLEVLAGIAAEL